MYKHIFLILLPSILFIFCDITTIPLNHRGPSNLVLQMKPLNKENFYITSIYDLLPNHPEIQYLKCHDAQPFDYKPFPISIYPEQQPHKGLFAETFVAIIPNGEAFSFHGFIKYGSEIISEYFSQIACFEEQIKYLVQESPSSKPKKYAGKVAVITRIYANSFSHWIYDIVGRLALLDMHNIEYDWLYVTYHEPFMKETLTAWGVDPKKIITPLKENSYIQADELIVPSLTYRRIPTTDLPLPKEVLLTSYLPSWMIKAFRDKYLPLIKDTPNNFSKKVFISRKDTQNRTIINEDEIFELFEKHGFKRYCLGKLSFLEQVKLFHGAETVIAAHGAGLTNLIFSDPGTTLLEIFQERSDTTYWYLAQTVNLNYHYIQTTDFKNVFGHASTYVDPIQIQEFIAKNIQ